MPAGLARDLTEFYHVCYMASSLYSSFDHRTKEGTQYEVVEHSMLSSTKIKRQENAGGVQYEAGGRESERFVALKVQRHSPLVLLVKAGC